MGHADKKGAFVQPALYEAFGLTVIEAMSCGLPTFATIRGGPAEVRCQIRPFSAAHSQASSCFHVNSFMQVCASCGGRR